MTVRFRGLPVARYRSIRAWISSIGAPDPPKPPIITAAPSGISATASANVAMRLSMDPPAFGLPYRRQRRTGKRIVRILTFVRHAADSVRMANKDIIGSLAKGLRVIEAFSAEHPRMSISDASDATGLDRATARRCLLTLHQLGYADYDGKFFTLTARVLRLGMGALAAMPLAQMVQPWLDQVSDRIGQSTSVSIGTHAPV